MDASTTLRRRVGDTPLVRAPRLAKHTGLSGLRLKLEGANPTGTQKDRIARLEVGDAAARGHRSVTAASCGNFGVAMAHAAHVFDLECHIFVPEDFEGERNATMQALGAQVHRVAGTYEDAVKASRDAARKEGHFDANPGGANLMRTLAGYGRIASELGDDAPTAVGIPIGNGSTLAGVHLGFRSLWAQGRIKSLPRVYGGTSQGNNPVPAAVAREQVTCSPLDPRAVEETHVNEPLVNWDALDGDACVSAVQDSQGDAFGFTDAELSRLASVLMEDGIDAHPASLAAVAALAEARKRGDIEDDAPVVGLLTSGRPRIDIVRVERPDLKAEVEVLRRWLGPYSDPAEEVEEAMAAALQGGHLLHARQGTDHVGTLVLTPMDLDRFFPRFHLSYVAVAAEGRGRGVGTRLLEEAVRLAGGDLSLHVERDNAAAIRLYEKFGFHAKYLRMLHRGTTPPVDAAQSVRR